MNTTIENYTVHETASLLRVAPKTIRRLIRRGDLNAYKVGGRWRINRAAIGELMKGANNGHGEPA